MHASAYDTCDEYVLQECVSRSPQIGIEYKALS